MACEVCSKDFFQAAVLGHVDCVDGNGKELWDAKCTADPSSVWPAAFPQTDDGAVAESPPRASDSRSSISALHVACLHGHVSMVELLLSAASSPPNPLPRAGPLQLSCLHAAVDAGARDPAAVGPTVRLLLDSGLCPLDARDKDGKTAIHRAAVAALVTAAAGAAADGDDDSGQHSLLEPLFSALTRKEIAEAVRLTDGRPKRTPLHMAVKAGQPQSVRVLLDHGAKLGALDKHKNNCLHFACNFNGPRSLVPLVVDPAVSADPGSSLAGLLTQAARDGKTPLLQACSRGNLRWVRILADVRDGQLVKDVADSAGNTAMHLAAARKDGLDTVKFLCKHFAGLAEALNQQTGERPLHSAAKRNEVATVAYLVKHAGVDVDAEDDRGYTALCAAAAANCRLTVSALVKRHASLTHRTVSGATPVFLAAEGGWLKVVKKLIEKGAPVAGSEAQDLSGATPLHAAAGRGFASVVTALLAAGAPPSAIDQTGLTPLHSAVHRGHVVVARKLLDAEPALIHVGDRDGLTPLHVAAFQGHQQAVEELLRRGADPAATSSQGMNSAHFGASHYKVLKVLLSHAKKQQPDDDGRRVLCAASGYETKARTPLHLAASAGSFDACAFLLQQFPDAALVNAEDDDGNTPFHLCCARDRSNCVPLFLDAGARLGLVNRQGMTPIQMCAGTETASGKLISKFLTSSGASGSAAASEPPPHPASRSPAASAVAAGGGARGNQPPSGLAAAMAKPALLVSGETTASRRSNRPLTLAPTPGLGAAPPVASDQEVEQAQTRARQLVLDRLRTEAIAQEPTCDAALDQLLQVLFAVDSPLLDALLTTAQPSDADKLAKGLVGVFRQGRGACRMLCRAIDLEVEATTSAGTLFRANSLASKMLTQFALAVGHQYLENTVLPPLNAVLAHDRAYEVDPGRVSAADDDEVADNQDGLLALTQSFLDSVCNSVSTCPVSLRALCQHLHSSTVARFPDADPSFAVGGFMFLRFITPAVVTPDGGAKLMEAGTISRESRRTLTLISKLLTNLANGVAFGQKEQFMQFANEFLQQHGATVSQFLGSLAATADGAGGGLRALLDDADAPGLVQDELVAAVNALYKHLCYNQPAIDSALNKALADQATSPAERDAVQETLDVMHKSLQTLGQTHPLLKAVSATTGAAAAAAAAASPSGNAVSRSNSTTKLERQDSNRTLIRGKMANAWTKIRGFGKK